MASDRTPGVPSGGTGPAGPAGPAGPQGPAGDPATNLVTSVAGRQGVVVLAKADVGLSNVDNTSDANKPVSTVQQTALDLKAPLASPAFTGTPTGITKTHVGLGNVDNTSDASKPVSTAQQAALDLKVNLTGGTLSGSLNTLRTSALSGAYTAAQTGDTQYRYLVDGNGKIAWGDGATTQDTNLYRSAADTLATDDRFKVLRSAANQSLEITNPHATGDGIVVNLGTPTRYVLLAAQTSDIEYRLKVNANGKIEWGDGSVIDTNLYRSAADTLSTDDRFQVLRNTTFYGMRIINGHAAGDGLVVTLGTATRYALQTEGPSDVNYRFQLEASGKMLWGDGTAVGDTNLYRSAADKLQTDDQFCVVRGVSGDGIQVGTPAATDRAIRTYIPGDGVPRLVIATDGKHTWGDGATTADTNLYRAGADQLATDDQVNVLRNATLQSVQVTNPHATGEGLWVTLGTATRAILKGKVSGDASARVEVDADGTMYWGPGTAGGPDTNLYRSAADTLKTDDAFVVASTFSVLRNGASFSMFIANTNPSGDAMSVWLGGAARSVLLAGVNNDGAYRFQIAADGGLSWGDGTFSRDTNLYRSAANFLKTDDSLIVAGSIDTGTNLNVGTSAVVGTTLKVVGNIGFYNATPAAKPTISGSRAGNAALADLLTKLAVLGLLTDSTTA